MSKKYYTDPVEVSLDGQSYWIQFTRPTGFIPGVGKFQAEALVKREKELLETINATKDATEKRELQARLVLPRLLTDYVQKGTPVNSSLFDFVGDPKEKKRKLEEIVKSEASLQEEVTRLKAENADLKAALADLKKKK
jgi:hypothetical protein